MIYDFIDVLLPNNIENRYWFPVYPKYDYKGLITNLIQLEIYNISLSVKWCNISTNKRCLTKLKKIFGNENVIHTNDKNYKIIININNNDFNEYMLNMERERKIKRICEKENI